MTKRYDFISDIHGNTPALAAVLDDIGRRRIDAVYNLGDSLFGPLDGLATFDLLISHNIGHIMGNGDRELLGPVDMAPSTMNKARQSLTSKKGNGWPACACPRKLKLRV